MESRELPGSSARLCGFARPSAITQNHIVFQGTSLLRLDGFAPADRWEELSPANLDGSQVA